MIPSGYKEDVVYSPIPTDGSGDLSFTRASNGTRINSAGLVEVVAWNLVQQSEQFNQSPWNLDSGGGTGSITVTNNYATAPNGTLTADRLQMVKGNIYSQTYQSLSVIVGAQYTLSVYLKSLSGTPTITTFYDTAPLGKKTITTEWVRYDFTFSPSASIVYPLIGLHTTDSATADILAWGYQVNIGSTAKPYFPTTDRLNVPRLTYQNGGGGCPSLLLEKQSTNLALYSEQFQQADWSTSDVTVTANTTTSPDGTQNADTIDAIAVGQRINQTISVSASTSYTFSFYAKKGTMTTPRYTVYDLSNNAFILSQVDYSSLINSSTWSRVTATFTTPVGCTSIGIYLINGVTTLGTIFLWGCQLEQSSYATSYIPTTSASATRVADACSKTGISSLIGQTEGVLFADVNWIVKPESGSPVVSILTINNNVANLDNCIILGIERQTGGGNRVYCLVQNAGSTEAGLFGSLISNGRYKIALAYKANDFVLYVNGVQIATDTSGSVPTTSEVLLGQRFTGDSVNLNDSINEAVLFKTRLTNAELASLTTL
jgi:hypothetical protein